MKNILIFCTWLMWLHDLFGQQESMMTQFMYQRLLYNPAYAGSYDAPELTVGVRQQWIGFEGAPTVQTLSFSSPVVSKRLALGLNLNNQTAGYESKQTVGLNMSYAIVRTQRWSLRGGIQMAMRRYGYDFKQAESISENDYALGQNFETIWLGNFGGGLYATYGDWYVGIAAPFLYENLLGRQTNTPETAKEYQHFFAMAGFSLPLNDKLMVKCNGLMKYTPNSTWVTDYNANFVYDEQLTVGVTYRMGQKTWSKLPESIDLLLFMNLNKKLSVGISYDIVLSTMAAQQKGSLEIALQYRWKKQGIRLSNPRQYF